MKIIAIVKFNDSVGLVFDKIEPLEYQQIGNSIFGTNGVFCQCYYYEPPYGRFKAFGGREFDITLTDGTVVKCDGQWWDGVTKVHREIVPDIVSVTAQDIDHLKDCYVFCRYRASKQKINEMIQSYTGKIFGYKEYEVSITNNFYRKRYWFNKNNHKDTIDFRPKKNWKRFNKKVLVGNSPLLTLTMP